MESVNLKKNGLKIEIILGYILIIGVIISLTLMITGIWLLYINTGNLNISRDQSMFIHGKNFFSYIFEIFQEKNFQNFPVLFLTLGTIVLMLIPFIRVIASLVYFACIKDLKYFLITLIVLLILSISLSLL